MASSNLVPLAVAGAGLWWLQSRKPKPQAAKAKPDEQPKSDDTVPPAQPLAPPLTPFVVGSQCTKLMSTPTLERWLDTTVATAALEVLDSTAFTPTTEELAIWEVADEVIARASEPCLDKSSDAYALAYKMVWCAVATVIVTTQAPIEQTPEEIMGRCQNEAFDPLRARPPRRPPAGPEDDAPDMSPAPPLPPIPTPPQPSPLGEVPELPDPVAPPPEPPTSPHPLGHDAPLPPPPGTPPNIESPTTREGIQESSLLRLVAAGEREGQTRARPSAVVLAFDPEWHVAEQVLAALELYAGQHPELSFYAISFWDTQQHFGLPPLLGGDLKYILSSANAEGIADRNPIIGNNAFPIQPTQWEAVLRHATDGASPGLVGQATFLGTAPRTPGLSRAAEILRFNRRPPLPSQPRAAPRRSFSTKRPVIPLHRFAMARLHRRLGT